MISQCIYLGGNDSVRATLYNRTTTQASDSGTPLAACCDIYV